MSKDGGQFVICVNNDGYSVSLQLRKVYRRLPDPEAEEDGMIRVIDESDEDYLFGADRFVPIELPAEAEKAFSTAL